MKSAATISKNWWNNSNYKLKLTDKVLWISILALIAAGVVMVYSSSFILAQEEYKDGLHFLKKHLTFILMGSIGFLLGWKFPVDKLRRLKWFFLVSATALLFVTLIPGIAHRAGGAARWIGYFGFRFQPSEFAKIAVILFVAAQIADKMNQIDNFRTNLLAYFLPPLPIYLLLLKQPDFGTTMLLVLTTVAMLWGAGIRIRYFLSILGVLIPIAATLIIVSPYRLNRVLGFLDPWSDPTRKGFQIIQSWLAFYSGQWFGVGVGNSHEKLFYLPKAHNDFIFAVIGEEWGFIGVIFLVSLFLIVVLRGLKGANRLEDMFHKNIAIGISSMIGLQAFFNMGVVLGLLPTKGVPLPLISYGGSSLIVSLLLLGLLTQLSERLE